MPESVGRFFRQLAQSIRFADVLDVLLVAAFLYALLTWVRRDTRPGTSWRLAVVLVFFAAVYLMAGAFSMYLVGRLLGALFVAFLLAAVVLFQSEIRRMIDRIGALSFQKSAAPSRGEQTLDLLTEAAGHMARERVGALMVVRGRDAWEGTTQGGILLEGCLSLPLLYSIFDERTPGHDGAVLIEEDRIVRFGTHLPLASELPEASRSGGTRHAAALGLAEQCDAFVIVVSEERGVVSVAERGRLTEMDSAGALRERLGRFWAEHYTASADEQSWWHTKNVRTALLALLMASFLWLAFAYEPGSTYRTLDLPVVFRNVEPTWMIGEPEPEAVSVGLSGSERSFRLLDRPELAVSFPFSELKEGQNRLPITEDNLDLPGGLHLEEARPQTIAVEAQRLREIRTRVDVDFSGTLPDSLRLRVIPDTVALMVPRDSPTPIAAIPTSSISFDSLRDTGPLQVELLPPEDTRLPEEERRSVEVRLEKVPRE